MGKGFTHSSISANDVHFIHSCINVMQFLFFLFLFRREKERLAHKLDCAPSQNTEDFMAAMDLDDLSVGAKVLVLVCVCVCGGGKGWGVGT